MELVINMLMCGLDNSLWKSHAPELVFVMVCSVACVFLKTEVNDELHMSRANEKPERPRFLGACFYQIKQETKCYNTLNFGPWNKVDRSSLNKQIVLASRAIYWSRGVCSDTLLMSLENFAYISKQVKPRPLELCIFEATDSVEQTCQINPGNESSHNWRLTGSDF